MNFMNRVLEAASYFWPAVADGFGTTFFGFFAFLLFGLLSPMTEPPVSKQVARVRTTSRQSCVVRRAPSARP